MKWFKHCTDASTNEKLMAVEDELGMAGSGTFWRLVEIIGTHFDKKMEASVTYPIKVFGNFCKSSQKVFKKNVEILEKNKLISAKYSGDFVTIEIINMLKYMDESTKKLARGNTEIPESFRNDAGKFPSYITLQEEEEEKNKSLSCPPVVPPSPAPPDEAPEEAPEEEGREEVPALVEAVRIFKEARAEFEAVWPEAPKTVSHTSLMLYDLAAMAARDPTRSTPEFWRSLAQRARASPFLRGEKPGSKGKYFPGMKFGWFVKPDTVAQILNGNFDETAAAKSPPPSAPRKEYPDGIKPLGLKPHGKNTS